MKKLFSALVAIALSLVIQGEANADAIDNLQPGQWYEVPNSRLDSQSPDIRPSPRPCGDGDTYYIMEAWSGGTFDTKRNRLLIFGGGHADYAGNEVYAFDTNTLTWSRIWGPSPNSAISCPQGSGSAAYTDGNPASRHSYDGITYIPGAQDKMWIFEGSYWSGGGNSGRDAWSLDLTTLTWHRLADPQAAELEDVCDYDPLTGNVLWAVGGAAIPLTSYNPTTNAHTVIGNCDNFGQGVGYYQCAAIDQHTRKFVSIGSGTTSGSYGYNQPAFVYDLTGSTPHIGYKQTTSGDRAMEQSSYPGVAYDPISQCLVAWNGGQYVYKLNTATWVWTRVSPTNGVNPGGPTGHGTMGRFQYVPSRNAFIAVSGTNQDVFFYKLTAGSGTVDVTPPTVSITAPTGGTVNGSISVTATASDDIGVVGVQFMIDGVPLQAEDLSAPYSIVWDTATASNGSHTLTAVARDGTNSTTSSGVSVTVSNASDTTPPTVSITSPTGGTVSGTVNVTANAADNVGVAGVQFTLDGSNLNAEDTSAPYSTSWNTATASNGQHTLRAVARDAATNTTTSTLVTVTVSNVASPIIGTLVSDGPATPEQICMYLPVTGALIAQTSTVRWKLTAGSTWTVGHPLYRIHPAYVQAAIDGGDIALGTHMTMPVDAFAGVVTGLTPGVSYTVEVTTRMDSGVDSVKTLVATTRDLPGNAATSGSGTNKTITAGSTQAQIQSAFNALNPGDVLTFADGTYNIDSNSLTLSRSGTQSNPIYITGTSRAGTIIHITANDQIFVILNASDIVLENMTLTGQGIDTGTNASTEAFRFNDNYIQDRFTIRHVTMTGIDVGVADDAESGGFLRQFLIYDCTLNGNDPWTQPFLETNLTWNDDGIRMPGTGNCAFNNTLSGFGDTFAVDNGMNSVAIHFYRNDIRWGDDDGFEADFGTRNITMYDNRFENTMTLISFDPLFGGPAFIFRNISINSGRSPYKFNSPNSGHFIYNNTVVRTTGYLSGADWGWNQSDNGDQLDWGFQNNILIWRGDPGHLMAMESSGNNPIDFTNNAWFPDAAIWWTGSGGSFSNLASAKAGIGTTTPVFSTATKRHANDVATVNDPFATDIALGSNYLTKVTVPYTPALSSGTTPKYSGAIIPGVTDGYAGAAPDIGAIIEGITPPVWGDLGEGGSVDAIAPSPPHNLRVR